MGFWDMLLQFAVPAIDKALAGEQSKPPAPVAHPAAPVIVAPDADLITFDDVVTASGKYPARRLDPEFTEQVKSNIKAFLPTLNAFLKELGIQKVTVTSGFRPTAVNAATPGAAKNSTHCLGKAVDIFDPGNSLNDLVLQHPELLKKYGLWVESRESTPNWCHLDCSTSRADRPIRVFKP